MKKIPQYLLSLAGEYRACSELNKRGIFATITYGNRKSVDVYVIVDQQRSARRIEVKTSQAAKFLTGIYQEWKTPLTAQDAPDFWMLVQIRHDPAKEFAERFFVLTHKEICQKQHGVRHLGGG